MVAHIDYSHVRLGLKKVVHFPFICHALQYKLIAMIGMPILINETCYVPYSQDKVGGTVRQLDSISYKRHVYFST